jgi:hypothetical protein
LRLDIIEGTDSFRLLIDLVVDRRQALPPLPPLSIELSTLFLVEVKHHLLALITHDPVAYLFLLCLKNLAHGFRLGFRTYSELRNGILRVVGSSRLQMRKELPDVTGCRLL